MKTSARALRTAPEAAERLLLCAAVSAVAGDFDREEVLAWLKKEGLWAKASPTEKAFLTTAQPSEKSKIHFSWQMESVYVLGWALHLVPAMAPPTAQASIGDILERVPGPGDRVGDFVASSKLRAAAEIHAAAEAAYSPAKPLDTSDFLPIWREHMVRYYVACTLRELGGLPQALPENATSVPLLRVFSSGPFS